MFSLTKINRSHVPVCSFFKCSTLLRTSSSQTQTSSLPIRSVRQVHRKKNDFGPVAWLLLVIPISAFGLGTWQVKRKKWKDDLIKNLQDRTSLHPVELPNDLSEISAMEYHPVLVRGTFDHGKELIVGPRSLIVGGDTATSSRSFMSSGQTGFHIITPFKLSDRDLTVLVNRGWVPQTLKNPATRQIGQPMDEIELIGVLRHAEERQPFMPDNAPESGMWYYRDLNKMCDITGASPIFLDAVASSSVPGGPIGGQTRVTLRNEHLSYILTWYSLSAATGYMWYRQFIAKAPMI